MSESENSEVETICESLEEWSSEESIHESDIDFIDHASIWCISTKPNTFEELKETAQAKLYLREDLLRKIQVMLEDKPNSVKQPRKVSFKFRIVFTMKRDGKHNYFFTKDILQYLSQLSKTTPNKSTSFFS